MMRKGVNRKGPRRRPPEMSPTNGDSSNHKDSQHGQQPRRKVTEQEAALTAKNYRLAKELSELRVRHREETKNVTRLTMENMNLASRCREAISHVAMLKKELAIHQKRAAEALAKQKQQLPRRMSSDIQSNNSNSDLGVTAADVVAEMERMDRLISAATAAPPPPPPEARSIETSSPEQNEEFFSDYAEDNKTDSPNNSDDADEPGNDEGFSEVFPHSASFVVHPKPANYINEGFPDDLPRSARKKGWRPMQPPAEITEVDSESAGSLLSTQSNTMDNRKTIMSSIDAFEASFNTDFPESFKSPREEDNQSPPGSEIYNPFFPSPARKEQPNRATVGSNENAKDRTKPSATSRTTPESSHASAPAPGPPGSRADEMKQDASLTTPRRSSLRQEESEEDECSLETSSRSASLQEGTPPSNPSPSEPLPEPRTPPRRVEEDQPKRPEKVVSSSARARYEKALQPRGYQSGLRAKNVASAKHDDEDEEPAEFDYEVEKDEHPQHEEEEYYEERPTEVVKRQLREDLSDWHPEPIDDEGWHREPTDDDDDEEWEARRYEKAVPSQAQFRYGQDEPSRVEQAKMELLRLARDSSQQQHQQQPPPHPHARAPVPPPRRSSREAEDQKIEQTKMELMRSAHQQGSTRSAHSVTNPSNPDAQHFAQSRSSSDRVLMGEQPSPSSAFSSPSPSSAQKAPAIPPASRNNAPVPPFGGPRSNSSQLYPKSSSTGHSLGTSGGSPVAVSRAQDPPQRTPELVQRATTDTSSSPSVSSTISAYEQAVKRHSTGRPSPNRGNYGGTRTARNPSPGRNFVPSDEEDGGQARPQSRLVSSREWELQSLARKTSAPGARPSNDAYQGRPMDTNHQHHQVYPAMGSRPGVSDRESFQSRTDGLQQRSVRRTVKHPVSYAEPSLNSKLRRGDVYFPKEEAPRDARRQPSDEMVKEFTPASVRL